MRPVATPARGVLAGPVWPLALPFVGFPVWWLLGVWQLMFFAMAVVMFGYLVRQKSIAMPRGFSVWLLWLLWLLVGLLVLQVDAPGTVAGLNMNRYLVFGYRFVWYLAATIAVLYVVNTRQKLSAQRIAEAVSWFFVILVGGGLLGLVAPGIDVPSVFQLVLPDSISGSKFVIELTQIRSAQIQDVLGTPQARPSAPFMYTNEWAAATAISFPFFVGAWWARGRRWRIATVAVLAVAVVPIVASLNRGLWVAIIAAAALVVVQSALRGNARALAVGGVVTVAAVLLLLFSPLGDLVTARLDNGRSDNVRENLAWTAVDLTAQGSPLVGYGTTREVEGNFVSIAGGASDACPGCEPPPVGTHGHLWTVIFGTGFVGAALYVGFLALQFFWALRVAKSTYSMAASATLLVLLVTLPYYGAVGVVLFVGFIAIGLLGRESRKPLPVLNDVIGPILRQAPAVLACAVIGGLSGFGLHLVAPPSIVATQRVLVPSAELVPVPGVRPSTLDSEALLVKSSIVTSAAAATLDVTSEAVRRAVTVGAEPNTRVLLINYGAETGEAALQGAEAVAAAYVEHRDELLGSVELSINERYVRRQSELDSIYVQLWPFVAAEPVRYMETTLEQMRSAWTSADRALTTSVGATQASMISEAVVKSSTDHATVRVAGGLAMGLLIGVPLIVLFDTRYRRLGNRPWRGAPLGLPVVATVSGPGAREAEHALVSYAPIAGVVADGENGRAVRMATRIDRGLSASARAGSRALIVVDARSRVGSVRRLIARMESGRMDPVGLILLRRNDRRRPRGAARDSGGGQ